MIRIRLEITEEAGTVPFGYGLAYRNWTRRSGVFYLIPLNLLVALGRQFYFAMVWKTWRWWEAGGQQPMDMKERFDLAAEQEVQRRVRSLTWTDVQ
jgi:hypothetical protein